MPLPSILKSTAGTCPFCHQKAGIIARARTHSFDEKTLRLILAEIARKHHGDGATVNEALEEGWKQGVAHSMADGTLTQAEETLLREFRVRYDRIVDFEPFSDGFGIMRDAQTATPQSFRTGDGDETRKRVKMLADAGELRVVEGKILPPKIGGMVGGLLLSLAKGGGKAQRPLAAPAGHCPTKSTNSAAGAVQLAGTGMRQNWHFRPSPLLPGATPSRCWGRADLGATRARNAPLRRSGCHPDAVQVAGEASKHLIRRLTTSRNAPLRRSGCHPDAVQVAGEASKHLIRRLTTSSTLSNIIVARARTTQILRYREVA